MIVEHDEIALHRIDRTEYHDVETFALPDSLMKLFPRHQFEDILAVNNISCLFCFLYRRLDMIRLFKYWFYHTASTNIYRETCLTVFPQRTAYDSRRMLCWPFIYFRTFIRLLIKLPTCGEETSKNTLANLAKSFAADIFFLLTPIATTKLRENVMIADGT
jgi:hypothetical protein